MTVTLSVNSNNDIYVGVDGNIALAYDLTATLQACAQAAKTILGEMVLNTDQGIPYFQVVWVGVPQLPQFEAALRSAWLAVEGVTDILSVSLTQSGDTLLYSAEILTVYGQGVING